MFDTTLKKAWYEVELLVLVVVSSLGVCSLVIADASIALVIERENLYMFAARALELSFGVVWLLLLVKMILEINRFRKKYFKTFYLLRLRRLAEEQKKSETARLVRDLVAFYRTHYRRVLAILVLAIAIGVFISIATAYLLLYGYMSVWVAVFRWILNSAMLLVASAFYTYVHRSWGRKLLKVKDAESKLSEILGGPLEA